VRLFQNFKYQSSLHPRLQIEVFLRFREAACLPDPIRNLRRSRFVKTARWMCCLLGAYSRHHKQRAAVLEAVAKMAGEYNIAFHLDRSRLCRLAESPLGRALPLAKHRRPPTIRAVTRDPIFGRDCYEVLSSAKIVLNRSIDMPSADRGNMRSFEALGGGSLLLTDEGNYPEGISNGRTMVTYDSPEDAARQIRMLLNNPEQLSGIARAGHEMVSIRYSKEVQWKRFEALVASI
jgi:hypothetical protein